MELKNEMLMSREKWYSNCQLFGYEYALNVLTAYVKNGQPDTFLPTCTGCRSMAKLASLGIEGISIDSDISYLDTKYGFDLYMKMFGNYDYKEV